MSTNAAHRCYWYHPRLWWLAGGCGYQEPYQNGQSTQQHLREEIHPWWGNTSNFIIMPWPSCNNLWGEHWGCLWAAVLGVIAGDYLTIHPKTPNIIRNMVPHGTRSHMIWGSYPTLPAQLGPRCNPKHLHNNQMGEEIKFRRGIMGRGREIDPRAHFLYPVVWKYLVFFYTKMISMAILRCFHPNNNQPASSG